THTVDPSFFHVSRVSYLSLKILRTNTNLETQLSGHSVKTLHFRTAFLNTVLHFRCRCCLETLV
ncbi:hypothetical protein C0J52_25737, partial [Blattella germanica]